MTKPIESLIVVGVHSSIVSAIGLAQRGQETLRDERVQPIIEKLREAEKLAWELLGIRIDEARERE